MKTARYNDYRRHLAAMNDDELENERYTLTHERRYLTSMSDEEVEDRLGACEAETTTRCARRFA